MEKKMEAVAKCNSRRLYSWWWDSHNTPKNSKWLQDNLADMDSNVKKMIKVLEEDADTFARRAEMYYSKRPELLKLVEEFYRQYRALAERYNHATGVIHQAHQTMAEAFPEEVALMFDDESHVDGLVNDGEPETPEMPPPIRARVNPDALGVKKNIDFSEETSSVSNVVEGDGKGDIKAQILSESERVSKTEAEIVALKESISKMQDEKRDLVAQFEKNLEKVSNLESEISRAQEDSRELNDRAASAEAGIQTLRETINKLDSEKESSFLRYQQCLQKIADLEDEFHVAHKDSEAENSTMKQSFAKAEADKEDALVQYKQCLKTISNLENRLSKEEEDARLINNRAEKAEAEVENLKQTISKLIEDKEASELQYQQCLNIIADLKLKLYHAQEVTQRLRSEREDGVAKLKFFEEKCLVLERSNQNLHSELDGLLEKLGNQSQSLTEKQTELVKLWSTVQEEHLRFEEAETALQTLKQLHSQSQEELNNLAVELQARSQIMKDMEVQHKSLHEEIQQAKAENQGLNELNLSSVASIKSLQEDVSSLKETRQQLEAEVKLRVDQRNELQQEIYLLKGECNEREKGEKTALLKKFETMEKLVEKNLILEKSISDLNIELSSVRRKLKTLENSFLSLSEENTSLVSDNQHAMIENLVLLELLRQANSEAVGIATENKNLEDKTKKIGNIEAKPYELDETCKKLVSKSALKDFQKLRRSQAIDMLYDSIKSLEDYVSVRRESEDELSKEADSMEDMCLRIKAIAEAVKEKEKILTLENSNAYSMLETALKEIKELKSGGRRSFRKLQGSSGKSRKQSQESEMITKDIVLDQTSDGSTYEIINKKGSLELDDHIFLEIKPVKTHRTETAAKGKSLSEESLIVDKLEIFDGFMDPNKEEVNNKKILERLDSDLQKLENLQITVEDLKSKVKTDEKDKKKAGGDEYEMIKGQLLEAEEAIEKLVNVNRKLTTKAESEKDDIRRKRITEQARRGSEKIGRLQLEIQRIQFLLVKLEGNRKDLGKLKISDAKSKVILRDYIYGGTRSVSMKKRTKKRAVFLSCVQQQRSP